MFSGAYWSVAYWTGGYFAGTNVGVTPPDPDPGASFMFSFGTAFAYVTIDFLAADVGAKPSKVFKRTDPNQPPAYTYSKNTADTITIEVSLDGAQWHTYATHASGTTTGGGTIIGRWNHVRTSKTGTAGAAKVEITV